MADFSVKVRMPGVRVDQASGTIDIHSNGVYDVADFAEANVSVPTEIPDGSVTMAKLATDVRANVANVPVLDGKVEDLEESATDLWEAVDGVDDRKQDKLTFDNAPNRYSDNPVKSSGIYNALSEKQNALTFDTTPTGWSNNPVTSHGIYVALQGKQETLTFDQTPASGSFNPVTSEGISLAIDMAQGTVEQELQAGLATKQDVLTFDNVPMAGSNNPVKSGGLHTVISEKAPLIYDTVQDQRVASFPDGMDGGAIKSLTLPLSPVQSFNGYDGPWPGGAGKNKLDINNEAPNSDAHIRRYLTNLPAGTYTVSAECHSTADTDCAVLLGYSDNTYTSTKLLRNNAWSSVTFDAEKDVTKVWVYSSINFASSQNYVFTQLNDLQVERGDAATSYEPYENICPISGWTGANVTVSPTTTGGTVYPVTWSEAGTVYGGEVDIVSGELVVDKAMVDLGTLAWVPYGATSSYDRYVSNGIDSTVKGGTIGICSHFRGSRSYAAGNIVIGTGTSKLTVFTTKGLYASASDFKTAMNGATFVYELASPQTYQLTPTQVMTLLGVNNVWSDTGDIEELIYPADTKLYIDKKIAQLNA